MNHSFSHITLWPCGSAIRHEPEICIDILAHIYTSTEGIHMPGSVTTKVIVPHFTALTPPVTYATRVLLLSQLCFIAYKAFFILSLEKQRSLIFTGCFY